MFKDKITLPNKFNFNKLIDLVKSDLKNNNDIDLFFWMVLELIIVVEVGYI